MSEQRDAGILFKINFLVYFMTIFVEITKATTTDDKCLLGVTTVEDIPHLDWCSYVLECLRRTRSGWKNPKIQYVGPVAFLKLLYAHEFNKRHRLFKQVVVKMPVIHYITSALIDQLEEHVSNKGPLTDNENENDCAHEQDHSTLLYAHEFNKRHRLFKQVVVKMPVIHYIMSALIDQLEEHVSNKGPLTDNENENDCAHEQDHSTEEFTIAPVDPSKCYTKGNTSSIEDREEPCNMTDDMLDLETSPLNLVMGVGTQTLKMLVYCSTPVQLSPSVVYCFEQQRQREASNINKRNLLKLMTSNMKKYNTIVSKMNNLVSDAKTKCFWDLEIM